jgi:hypothetical protein
LERFADASASARQATNGSRGFIDALATTWPVEQATTRFTAWSQQDPERVKKFLNQHAESDFIQQISGQLAASGIDLTPAARQGGGNDPFEPAESRH